MYPPLVGIDSVPVESDTARVAVASAKTSRVAFTCGVAIIYIVESILQRHE